MDTDQFKRSEKNYEIETLRAVAILFVVFQHSFNYLTFWIPPWAQTFGTFFSFGQAGVDIFFAVSGYVIAKSFLPDLDQAHSRLDMWRTMIAFWIKRIFRLWPTVALWVLIDVVLSWQFNKSGAFGSIRQTIIDGVAALAQVANVHQPYCGQPNVCFDSPVYPLGPLWSLSLEEQFYLVFPIAAVSLLMRKRFHLLLPALALLAILQLFLARPDGNLLLYVRTDALCGGVIVYLLSSSEGVRLLSTPLRSINPAYKIAVLALVFTIILLTTGRVVSFNAGISAIIATIIVFIAHFQVGWFSVTPKLFLRSIVNWIAARSYSIYVIHCIGIAITRELWWRLSGAPTPDSDLTLKFYATWVVVLIVLSELNWRLVESPLRARGRQIADAWLQRRDEQAAG